jgi:hypothetical protein
VPVSFATRLSVERTRNACGERTRTARQAAAIQALPLMWFNTELTRFPTVSCPPRVSFSLESTQRFERTLWPGMAQIGQIESVVEQDGVVSNETRYFITSVPRALGRARHLLAWLGTGPLVHHESVP